MFAKKNNWKNITWMSSSKTFGRGGYVVVILVFFLCEITRRRWEGKYCVRFLRGAVSWKQRTSHVNFMFFALIIRKIRLFFVCNNGRRGRFICPLVAIMQQRRRYFLISRPCFNFHRKIVLVPTFVTIERLIQLKSKEKSNLFIYSGQISLPPFWNSVVWWSSLWTANKLPPPLTARPTYAMCVCTHFSRLVRNLCVRRRVRPAAVCSAGYIAISCPGAKGKRSRKEKQETSWGKWPHRALAHLIFPYNYRKMYNKKLQALL